VSSSTALGSPGSLLLNGIFDASPDAKRGDVLFVAVVPASREEQQASMTRPLLIVLNQVR
jgi:hypothetical protein